MEVRRCEPGWPSSEGSGCQMQTDAYGRFLFVLCTAGQADLTVDWHSERQVANPSADFGATLGRLGDDLRPTLGRLCVDLDSAFDRL